MRNSMMQRSIRLLVVAALWVLPSAVLGQGDGARTYWHTLAGSNAVNFWYINAASNANPADPAQVVMKDSDFSANLAVLGFHKELPLFGRSARVSLLLPFGHIAADKSIAGSDSNEAAGGFGDPGIQFGINLYGAPAIRSLAEHLRYEPVFTVDVIGSMHFPIGQYDDDKNVNIGQNRWYGRLGMPMVYTLAPWIPWVPGQRTTVELLPAVWLFGDNYDFSNPVTGKQVTLGNDPLLQLEAHLTRDLTESFWISADLIWLYGAKPEFDGSRGAFSPGKSIDRLAIGPTLSFQATDNLVIGASYSATVNDSGSNKLTGNEFRLSLTYGWHSLVEGMKRLDKE